MQLDRIREFAAAHGYDGAMYLKEWQGYSCYEPYRDDDASCMGLGLLILVKEDEIRMSTTQEAMQI